MSNKHSMLKEELNLLLDRVLAWPPAAQEKLLLAIHEIEDRLGLHYSPLNKEKTRSSNGLDPETEAFFKRHPFWF